MTRGFIALFVALLTATALAQSPVSEPRFEAASVKPNRSGTSGGSIAPSRGRLTIVNMPLRSVVAFAHGMRADQVVDGPAWMTQERFDISATVGAAVSADESRQMLRALLIERFRLQARVASREVRGWSLLTVRADRQLGPSIKPCGAACDATRGSVGAGKWSSGGQTMAGVASFLQAYLRAPVADLTGLHEQYAVDMQWSVPEVDAAGPGDEAAAVVEAVRSQLGLKVESSRVTVDVVVVERVERPTPD